MGKGIKQPPYHALALPVKKQNNINAIYIGMVIPYNGINGS